MMGNMRRYWSLYFSGAFLALVVIYLAVMGENAYLQVHDLLDSHPAWMKMLRDNGLFWQVDGTVPFLHGISRNNLYSETKVYTWLIMAFEPFYAIWAGWIVKIILSIVGFLFLGKTIWGLNSNNFNTIAMVGFLYGITPSFPPTDISFASLPLLLAVWILLYREFRWKYLLALLLLPMLLDFAMHGLIVCGYSFLFFVLDWVIHHQPKWRLLLGTVALSIGSVIADWRLFYVMLLSGEPSLRQEFAPTYVGIREALRNFYIGFTVSMYHCMDVHKYVVLPTTMIYFLWHNVSCYRRNLAGIWQDKFNWLILLIVFNAFVYGIDNLEGFRTTVKAIIPPLAGFNFSRTLWLNGVLWYFAFAWVLLRIANKKLRLALMAAAFIVLCGAPRNFETTCYNHIYNNVMPHAYQLLKGKPWQGSLSYREFYSTSLFERIKADIGYNGEWSIAYGMHPAIIEYSGIATLDGYLSFYPLRYKHEFRELIAPELAVAEKNKKYFDTWGGRAYIFSQDIGYAPVRQMEQEAVAMLIDPAVFRAMGGRFVFSRVRVTNAAALDLTEVGVYTDAESPYTIYVYRLS